MDTWWPAVAAVVVLAVIAGLVDSFGRVRRAHRRPAGPGPGETPGENGSPGGNGSGGADADADDNGDGTGSGTGT